MKVHHILRSGIVTAFLIVAAVPGYSADLKIGVVNAVKVLEGAPQAEAARTKLQKEFAPKDKQLVAAQKSIKQLEDKLAKDGAIMSDANRKSLERDIVSKRRDLKRSQDEFRDDLNFRRNEEFSKIQKQIVTTIQNLAKQEGYDLIVGEGVIYASDKVDLTDKVIQQLSK